MRLNAILIVQSSSQAKEQLDIVLAYQRPTILIVIVGTIVSLSFCLQKGKPFWDTCI